MTKTQHSATLARTANGNWSLTCTADRFPPMAYGHSLSEAEAVSAARTALYVGTRLRAADVEPGRLDFVPAGHTVTADGTRHPAYRAEFEL